MAQRDPRKELSKQALSEYLECAQRLSDLCMRLYQAHSGQAHEYQVKPDGTPVSTLDLETERSLREAISAAYPDHSILGEEFGDNGSSANYCWVIDPVDGTDDLIRGLPFFGYIIVLKYLELPIVSVIGHPEFGLNVSACFEQGTWLNQRKIYLPENSERPNAAISIPAFEDFVRHRADPELFLEICRSFPNYRVYRNVYSHTAVISGALEAAMEYRIAEWDIVATRLAIEEAGGDFVEFDRYCDSDGNSRISAVFGMPAIVSELMSAIQRAGEAAR